VPFLGSVGALHLAAADLPVTGLNMVIGPPALAPWRRHGGRWMSRVPATQGSILPEGGTVKHPGQRKTTGAVTQSPTTACDCLLKGSYNVTVFPVRILFLSQPFDQTVLESGCREPTERPSDMCPADPIGSFPRLKQDFRGSWVLEVNIQMSLLRMCSCA